VFITHITSVVALASQRAGALGAASAALLDWHFGILIQGSDQATGEPAYGSVDGVVNIKIPTPSFAHLNTMQRTLGDQPDHVIYCLQAFVAVGFTPTHPWSFGHLQDPHGIFQLPDENGILSVLLLRNFGKFTVNRVGLGDALKGLSGVWPASV
jgi:hypothetical protein